MAMNGRQTHAGSEPPTACERVGFYECDAALGGGCCPVGSVCGPTVYYDSEPSPDQTIPLATCSGHNGYFACPTALGDGCCPGGYICDATIGCRLTLKLSVATTVISSTFFSL
ncbi:hypothetical protein V8F20_001876 [Naviculisporaceae sp. PSN 640]